MEFRIADTFTDSLARLTGDEQKAVKTTAFDLQLNPVNPGMSFHKLEHAKDKNFWSVRVSRDIRMIVHRTHASLLLCYVDHHDKAYEWAERRKLETHPKTGAAQLVEVRETVQEIVVPYYVRGEAPETSPASVAPAASKPLFIAIPDDELLAYGVPPEWLADVKRANEDSLLALTDHLPAEASEALLELATGGRPRMALATSVNPFDHPDAQRRFRTMSNVEELQRALEFPWDKWSVFLHPEQREWVERDFRGPARVAGSAGTGKTIVALHRAAYLARKHADARVLLATFSDALANALKFKLNRLLAHEPRLAERIDVYSLDAIALRVHKTPVGPVKLASHEDLRQLVLDAADTQPGHRFSHHFLLTEWEHVVDAWQLDSWEAYRDVVRLGRRTRLPEAQRALAWSVFEHVRAGLQERNLLTNAMLFASLAKALGPKTRPIFDFAVIDEAQDIGVSQLRFLVALGGGEGALRPNALFFAGDLGQRIFQQPFSWKSLGVAVRGRSRTLRVNYRTSHQIRAQADRLLDPAVTDVDGNTEVRSDTVSVFNGPAPQVQVFGDAADESTAVSLWLRECASAGVQPNEIGVFVRSNGQLSRAEEALRLAEIPYTVLDDRVALEHDHASVSTMHLAKGLEFRAVAVMACDDEVIPLQARIETVGDDGDLQEVYDTERQLLYVACTRARDRLLVSGTTPSSEFLDDLAGM
jgi:superfamily I DNA/RNA helicase/mRNA-degrading endonuclease RelE of RelBE toxin-antitoxin system